MLRASPFLCRVALFRASKRYGNLLVINSLCEYSVPFPKTLFLPKLTHMPDARLLWPIYHNVKLYASYCGIQSSIQRLQVQEMISLVPNVAVEA